MTLKNVLFYICFMPLALVGHAQTAINSGADNSAQGSITSTLPLRNLSIEVRQINQTSAEQSGISARGNIRLRPNASSANVDVNAQQTSSPAAPARWSRCWCSAARRRGISNSVPLRLVSRHSKRRAGDRARHSVAESGTGDAIALGRR
jgi:hypothetical protein